MSSRNRGLVTGSVAAVVLILLLVPAAAWAQDHRHHGHDVRASAPHPDPRPGVSADDVVHPRAGGTGIAEVYRMASAIPHVLDGIRCPCGCAEDRNHYSLLTCFGRNGLASGCGVCREAARLAYRLHDSGSDLDAIRAAVDAAFGGSGGP